MPPSRTCPGTLVFLLVLGWLAPAYGQTQPSPVNNPPPPPPFPVEGSTLLPVQADQPPPPQPANNAAADPFAFLSSGPGGAVGGPGLMFGRVVGQVPAVVSYNVTWLPEQPVRNQFTNLGTEQQRFSVLAPLYQDSANELSLTSHVGVDLIQTRAVLPTSAMPFPSDLWNVGLGGTYRHLFDNGWIAGGSVSIGSASDKPFNSINEVNLSVTSFLRIPSGEHNAWLFSLSYSPTAQLAFPIPGVAYQWVPNDRFQANLGIPFAIIWRPIDDLLLNLSYVPLTNINARATYRVWGPVRVYTGYHWTNQGYFLADRTDNRDRFLYYDMRVVGGVQANLGAWSLDLSSGYAFDRYYTMAHGASVSGADRVDIGAGPFLSLGVRLRW
jgi:hypothetical protein